MAPPFDLSALIEQIAGKVADLVVQRLRDKDNSAAPSDSAPYMTVEKIHEETSLSKRQIRAAISAGCLKASRPKGARTWVVRRDDLVAWLRGDDETTKLDLKAEARRLLT